MLTCRPETDLNNICPPYGWPWLVSGNAGFKGVFHLSVTISMFWGVCVVRFMLNNQLSSETGFWYGVGPGCPHD